MMIVSIHRTEASYFMSARDEFIELYTTHIHREGADRLLDYLKKSDFFRAPSSTRFHGSHEGGLVEHSVNVYHCLKDYLARPRTRELYHMDYSEETIAIVSLLHDLCKIDFYQASTRNVKNDAGVWEKVPCYTIDDKLPYGHGEKSVYIISGFLYGDGRLSREEAFAIRYHMGFSGIEDKNTVGRVFEQYPLAFALSVADMEASYYLEGTN